MFSNVSYYLFLYLLVFFVRFLKLKKGLKVENDSNLKRIPKIRKRELLYVSLEIVYTSAGFIIMFFQKQTNLIGPLIIVYIILVMFSTSLDLMEDKFSEYEKALYNLLIILLIIGGTIYSIINIINPMIQQEHNNNNVHVYSIAIPYYDQSLIQQLGFNKFSNQRLFYHINISAHNSQDAISKADSSFWADTTITPFLNKRKSDKKNILKIDNEQIVSEKLE